MLTKIDPVYNEILDKFNSEDEVMIDEKGKKYVYYPLNSIMADFGCSKTYVLAVLKYLQNNGMIYREPQRGAKPRRIYLEAK